jgi:hypothetical protein
VPPLRSAPAGPSTALLADSTQKGLLERAIKRYIKRRRLDAGLARPYLLVIQVGEDE